MSKYIHIILCNITACIHIYYSDVLHQPKKPEIDSASYIYIYIHRQDMRKYPADLLQHPSAFRHILSTRRCENERFRSNAKRKYCRLRIVAERAAMPNRTNGEGTGKKHTGDGFVCEREMGCATDQPNTLHII